MKALVVYESMYGNTRHVAEAIAEGLNSSIDARVMLVGDATAADVADVQLLVIGAPTHAWSLSRRRTRQAAAKEVAKQPDQHVSSAAVAAGVREWLRSVRLHGNCPSAAFDTRLDRPRLFTGSAVRSIERGLLAAGFTTFGESHSFRVRGTTGPLAFGEIERAREWGEAMGRAIVQIASSVSLDGARQ
ncbi:MAG: flavodoxin domain-containing protein [Actinomycetota bacterium]|nr:flavodoxin domain-containing protein [Actinomycetota bacterium]